MDDLKFNIYAFVKPSTEAEYIALLAEAILMVDDLVHVGNALEKLFVGQRSGVSPLLGSLRSQNQSNVRRSRVSRNAVCRTVSAEGGIGPLIPVIDVAVVHAEATTRTARQDRRSIGRISGIAIPLR